MQQIIVRRRPGTVRETAREQSQNRAGTGLESAGAGPAPGQPQEPLTGTGIVPTN